jgi:hypothetical protein
MLKLTRFDKESYTFSISHSKLFFVPTKIKDVPLRVLFLSSDTGGGHRASAEALAKQVREYI